MAVVLKDSGQDNVYNILVKRPFSSKIQDNFLDACSIPVGKVQFSLSAVSLEPALSLKELFLVLDMKELLTLLNQLCPSLPSFCRGYFAKQCLISP